MTTPRRGTVAELVANLLDRQYEQAATSVLNAIGRSMSSGIVAQRLDELNAEALRLADEGRRLRADNPVLRALLADMQDELRAGARLVDGAAPTIQQAGAEAAGRIQRQLALGGMTDAQLARIGIRWNVPDPEAINRVIGYAQSTAWADELARFPAVVVDTVRNQAIRGIAYGWNPLRTAEEISLRVQNLPQHQANNLMRTLQLTSYRDGTSIHQTANVAIVQDVIRIAALDDRTCMSCVARHGEVIWSSETDSAPVPRVNDHHQGRCNSVVRVRGRELQVRSGPEWFESLPEDRQETIAGPARLEAMRAGAIGWQDMSESYTDPVFGEMLREASLEGMLGAGAQQYYK